MEMIKMHYDERYKNLENYEKSRGNFDKNKMDIVEIITMEDGYDNVYMENIYSRKIVLLERVDEEELDYLNKEYLR